MTYKQATTEQLLSAFQAYLWQYSLDFIDLEPSATPVEMAADCFPSDSTAARQFVTIAQTGEASVAVLWQAEIMIIAERPVVWIASDGYPNGIVANSLREFLSLLPYGISFITDALRLYIKHKEIHEDVLVLTEVLATQQVQKYLTEARETNAEQHDAFVDWLRNTVGIEPAENPAAVIEKALRTHPTFDTWYETQLRAE
jgi:hypothetical protein